MICRCGRSHRGTLRERVQDLVDMCADKLWLKSIKNESEQQERLVAEEQGYEKQDGNHDLLFEIRQLRKLSPQV